MALRPLGTATTSQEQQAEAALTQGFSDRVGQIRYGPAVAAVVSPMCQAVDAACFRVEGATQGADLFLKILSPDAEPFVDLAASHAGAVAAADAGVAPPVTLFLPQHRALGFVFIAEPWRTARLHDLCDPATMQAIITAKQALRRQPPLPRAWNVFAQVRSYLRLGAAGISDFTASMPADLPRLVSEVERIEAALLAAGQDDAPCHNDGVASNVLLGPAGQVRLVDFDCAGQADPHYDLAVLLNEAYAFTEDWSPGIELHEGHADGRVLNRCRAYAVADDLMWGLWGLILSATSPRRDLEFLKYGEWRMLRCRMALADPGFADRLHRL